MHALGYPFRFNRGRAVRVDDHSESHIAQQIAVAVLTRPGELPLHPDFGTEDPVFSSFDDGGLTSSVETHIPHATVDDIAVEWLATGHMKVIVSFTPTEEENDDALA